MFIFLFTYLGDSERCKKHWKNIRDRFVKVMHQRDKHFASGGTELNAPQYIYYDKLSFMRDFSIQKHLELDATNFIPVPMTISPDHLIFEEFKESTGETINFDYTEQFLQHIKGFTVLYDQQAEMRKYRSKEAWKQLADLLENKFTVGKLRHYWITLLKKYKMYLESSNSNCESIENETFFESLSFTSVELKVKDEHLNSMVDFIVQPEETDSNQEYYEDLNEEEHLICEDVETAVETPEFTIDPEIEEPELKKQKIDSEVQVNVIEVSDLKPSNPPEFHSQLPVQETPIAPPPIIFHPATPVQNDEFDYFGKKVALQLRNLAHKNRIIARKGEIQVLQLLMELEETLVS